MAPTPTITKVTVRRDRRNRYVFKVTVHHTNSAFATVTYDSGESLRETIARILSTTEPPYELDIKVKV